MKRFNAAMQVIFFLIGFFGAVCMGGINLDSDNWVRTLIICFSVFIIGFIGAIFFDNPARFVRYIVGALFVICAAIYKFCHEIKELFEIIYDYKKRCGTYKKTFHKASNEYYRHNSTYKDEKCC